MINNQAVAHFKRHQDLEANLKGPWQGLSAQEIAEDVQTADWVPNRARWRAQGLKGLRHAQEVLG